MFFGFLLETRFRNLPGAVVEPLLDSKWDHFGVLFGASGKAFFEGRLSVFGGFCEVRNPAEISWASDRVGVQNYVSGYGWD